MDFDLELYQGNMSTQQTGVEQSPIKVCKVEVDSTFFFFLLLTGTSLTFSFLICLKSARDLCDEVQLKKEGTKQSWAEVLTYSV